MIFFIKSSIFNVYLQKMGVIRIKSSNFVAMIPQMAWYRILITAWALSAMMEANGRSIPDSLVIEHMFAYRATIDTTTEGHQTTAYMRYQVKTERRNPILLTIPNMHNFAQENRRSIVGEYLVALTYHDKTPCDARLIARTSTIRRHRTMLPNIYDYLTPDIYRTTLFYDRILSPFHPSNKRYYRYFISKVMGKHARVEIHRRASNTQTVRGHAIVDMTTGKVISCSLSGEYDFVFFELSLVMGEEGMASLLPVSSRLKAKFAFVGNRLRAVYETTYNVADSLTTTETDEESRKLIRSIRPDTLTKEQSQLYAADDSMREERQRRREEQASLPPRRKPFTDVLWNVVGENLLHDIRGDFGKEERGYYRIYPILNPINISYSERRGLSYRFVTRMGYDFSENMDINTRIKMGYSFKYRQLLTDIPVTYNFDKRNNGYVKFRWTAGELLSNSTVIDKVREERGDTVDLEKVDLGYFRHYKTEVLAHYDFTPMFGLEAGVVFNRWTSVIDKDFRDMGKPTRYQAIYWTTTASLRPLGWKGPVITFNYDRTIPKWSKERMNFEKWEADCSYIHSMTCLRSLSMRVGGGLYTLGGKGTYFLDFNNFRNDYIPGGWNDEWSGEFELLHRNWYNSSKYYFRMNATYESPMLILSWLPLAGNLIEKERLYLSGLHLKGLSHYIEVGYGLTNQYFSMGLFAGFKRGEYYSIGCNVEFELFNRW